MVSLTGGRGENILTSLVVGGGGAGATNEARSVGGRAGMERPGGGARDVAGEAGEGAGELGGREVLMEAKRPRLGLGVIGVPSSSKSSGEVRLRVGWVGSCWCGGARAGALGGEVAVEGGRG